MSDDDEVDRHVGEPYDPTMLRGLGAHCLEDARKAMRAGHHSQGRRLDILGRQPHKQVEKAHLR